MKRRKFILGAGSLAAGGAAAMGTGAFSFAQTDREISVGVATDPNSYLGLQVGGENGQHASLNGDGELVLDFGSSGLNSGSVYLFDDVARIANNGGQEVAVSIPDTTSDGYWSTNFVAYVGDEGSRRSIWPKDGNTGNFDDLLNDRASSVTSLSDLINTGPNSVAVGSGNVVELGVAFAIPDSLNAGASKSTEITIRAEET